MTERKWLTCDDPGRLLRYLRYRGRKLRSAEQPMRKWLLAGYACCRRAWSTLDPASKVLLQAAERAADGLAGQVGWQAELAAQVHACRSSCMRWLLCPSAEVARAGGMARIALARQWHKGSGQRAYEARRATIAQERQGLGRGRDSGAVDPFSAMGQKRAPLFRPALWRGTGGFPCVACWLSR
jgi:hypothetical protein